MSYTYVLALCLLATVVQGQVTYWTGGGGSGNNTFSNPLNWNNGVPTMSSVVYINDTGCNGCTITFDMDMTVGELHLAALTSTGPYLYITASLTVVNKLSVGSPTANTEYGVYVYINGGSLNTAATCQTDIYYTGTYAIVTESTYTGKWSNKGTVTFHSNGGTTSSQEIDIGDNSGALEIDNWGTFVATDPLVYVRFYYLTGFNQYAGGFNTTWTAGSSPYATLQWYQTDFNLQDGSQNTAYNGPLYFYSYYSISNNYIPTTRPSRVLFNCTGATLAWALLEEAEANFPYPGTLQNCNFTSDAYINGTSMATITGTNNNFLETTWLVSMVSNPFQVIIASGASVTMTNTFGLFGNVQFINNGTFVFNSNSDLYFDASAYWVNLGLMDVINYSNDWIQGSTFPNLATATAAGTIVNMGTIQFSKSGGLNFHAGTGYLYQCKHGVLKYGYGIATATDYPGSVSLAQVQLDGYAAIYFSSSWTSDISSINNIFTWVTSFYSTAKKNIWSGSLTEFTKGGSALLGYQICYDTTAGDAVLTKISDGLCEAQSGHSYISESNNFLTSTACDMLPASITGLTASCPVAANCGFNTGAPAGSGPAPGSTGMATTASLAFLVSSLLALYFQF